MHINRYACQSNVHVKSSNPKPKYVFPNNFPNVHPIVAHNISKNVSFSRPDSYVSYADWLNESQGQENWTIEENFFVAIFVAIYIYTWTSLNRG